MQPLADLIFFNHTPVALIFFIITDSYKKNISRILL